MKQNINIIESFALILAPLYGGQNFINGIPPLLFDNAKTVDSVLLVTCKYMKLQHEKNDNTCRNFIYWCSDLRERFKKKVWFSFGKMTGI